uniref:Uncharacterized protein n=1 Tax=Panagrellus redivivus TaxID=6233 RepID=A0A7E4VM22_PANRE
MPSPDLNTNFESFHFPLKIPKVPPSTCFFYLSRTRPIRLKALFHVDQRRPLPRTSYPAVMAVNYHIYCTTSPAAFLYLCVATTRTHPSKWWYSGGRCRWSPPTASAPVYFAFCVSIVAVLLSFLRSERAQREKRTRRAVARSRLWRLTLSLHPRMRVPWITETNITSNRRRHTIQLEPSFHVAAFACAIFLRSRNH